MEPYDRTSDPIDHLENLKTILLHWATNGIFCQAFPSILHNTARYWYLSLQTSLISSFKQLSRSFVAHFVTNQGHCRGSNSLVSIKQRGEHLQEYINRFNATIVEVRNLDQSMAMTLLKGRLQKNVFLSLEKRYPKNFVKMLASKSGKICE